jgi:hypothetical protein
MINDTIVEKYDRGKWKPFFDIKTKRPISWSLEYYLEKSSNIAFPNDNAVKVLLVDGNTGNRVVIDSVDTFRETDEEAIRGKYMINGEVVKKNTERNGNPFIIYVIIHGLAADTRRTNWIA